MKKERKIERKGRRSGDTLRKLGTAEREGDKIKNEGDVETMCSHEEEMARAGETQVNGSCEEEPMCGRSPCGAMCKLWWASGRRQRLGPVALERKDGVEEDHGLWSEVNIGSVPAA